MACCRLFLLYSLMIGHYCTFTIGFSEEERTESAIKTVKRSLAAQRVKFDPNITGWKYPDSKLILTDTAPSDEYEDDDFAKILRELLSISHEDNEEYYPFGMYPYLFPGMNPYQFGQCEARLFQKEALPQNAMKTTVEFILLYSPFLTYVFLWIYVEFLAILILPLVGFILFRFVALPLGELIGGKETRKHLRSLVIMIEKSRRDWVRWMWPENRKLPPWRYRTPKILRHDNEGSIPWELMEEEKLQKLGVPYPQRWQINQRLQKWKEKATKPECYAEKWVFKMIHRKLLRDRSFYVAPYKYKWGGSVSDSSSGTSTSESDEETEKTLQPQGSQDSSMSVFENCFRKDYKERKRSGIFTNKRTMVNELQNLKSSHRGIILDQTDQNWPRYTGAVYQGNHENEKNISKFQLKGWNYIRMGLGSKTHFQQTMKKWKPKNTVLVLKKREIDALARVEKTNMNKEGTGTVTYNLAMLDKIRQKKKLPVSSDLSTRRKSSLAPDIKLKPKKALDKRRGSLVFKNKTGNADKRSSVSTSTEPSNKKLSIQIPETDTRKSHDEGRHSGGLPVFKNKTDNTGKSSSVSIEPSNKRLSIQIPETDTRKSHDEGRHSGGLPVFKNKTDNTDKSSSTSIEPSNRRLSVKIMDPNPEKNKRNKSDDEGRHSGGLAVLPQKSTIHEIPTHMNRQQSLESKVKPPKKSDLPKNKNDKK